MEQHKYQSRYLVTTKNDHSLVNVSKYETGKFDEAFLILKRSWQSLWIKGCTCPWTEACSDSDISFFDGNTLLVGRDNDYVYISGLELNNLLQKINF